MKMEHGNEHEFARCSDPVMVFDLSWKGLGKEKVDHGCALPWVQIWLPLIKMFN